AHGFAGDVGRAADLYASGRTADDVGGAADLHAVHVAADEVGRAADLNAGGIAGGDVEGAADFQHVAAVADAADDIQRQGAAHFGVAAGHADVGKQIGAEVHGWGRFGVRGGIGYVAATAARGFLGNLLKIHEGKLRGAALSHVCGGL